MADEIKKVITIDTGESITSLKEYKKHIDELRGALLALDEDSEEYAAIVAEIQEEQAKLNEVMKAGKETTEAADGSYNQLVATMAELKKQWRATADEAERADLGQQILDINNRLKDLDASTGNFQRNVGDYANAFEEAFKTGLEQIGGMNANVSVLAGDVKKMIPLIKSVTKTATAGLSGIKKAIASTGIGLLIVAVGELIAHWGDLKNMIAKVTGKQDEYTAAVERSKKAQEELKEEVKRTNNEIQFQMSLMAAQGKSRKDQLKYELDAQKQIKQDLWDQYNAKQDFYNLHKNDGSRQMRQIAELNKQEADAIFEQIKAQEELIQKTQQAIQIEEAALEKAARDRIKAIEDALLDNEAKLKAQYEQDLALAEQYGLDTTKITEKYLKDLQDLRDAAANAKKTTTDADIELEQARKQAAAILETLRTRNFDELQLLEDKYNREKAILERVGEDTVELTRAYEEQRRQIIKQQEDAIAQEYIQAEQERYAAILENYEKTAAQAMFEAENTILEETEVEQAQRIAQAKYDIERQLIENKIQMQRAYIADLEEVNGESFEAEQQLAEYQQELANLDMARAKAVADYEKEQAKQVMEYKKATWDASLTSAASIFGALADLMDQGSEEAKALSIMETTINTIAGAIGAFMQASSSYPAPYGQIIGGATAAAVTAAGIAEINKIRQTTKSSANSASVSAPSVSTPDVGAIVSPLLNEDQDIQGMITLPETPRSQQQTDTRVYVVESDIAEAGKKVEVREHEATF